MKRIISIFFLTIMLVVSIHPLLSMHFCQGKLSSFSLMKEAGSCCATMDMNRATVNASLNSKSTDYSHYYLAYHKENCCKTHNMMLSTDNYNYQNQHLSFENMMPVFTSVWIALHTLINYVEPDTSVGFDHLFPPNGQNKLNIDWLTYICTFLI